LACAVAAGEFQEFLLSPGSLLCQTEVDPEEVGEGPPRDDQSAAGWATPLLLADGLLVMSVMLEVADEPQGPAEPVEAGLLADPGGAPHSELEEDGSLCWACCCCCAEDRAFTAYIMSLEGPQIWIHANFQMMFSTKWIRSNTYSRLEKFKTIMWTIRFWWEICVWRNAETRAAASFSLSQASVIFSRQSGFFTSVRCSREKDAWGIVWISCYGDDQSNLIFRQDCLWIGCHWSNKPITRGIPYTALIRRGYPHRVQHGGCRIPSCLGPSNGLAHGFHFETYIFQNFLLHFFTAFLSVLKILWQDIEFLSSKISLLVVILNKKAYALANSQKLLTGEKNLHLVKDVSSGGCIFNSHIKMKLGPK
jgi:hypothetical protein